MPEGNPLVAQAQSQTTGVTGIGILESANDLASGVKDGSWVEGGLGAVGVGLEALSLVVDPIGTLAQYGVSWLIEHVKPLKDCLDWLAGNPPVIQSFSDTWANVAKEVQAIAGDLSHEAQGGTAGWSGAAGDAYRGEVAEQVDAVAGAASLCDGISTGVMVMGQVVAAVRETVRDLIAQLVGKLITWALEEACTLGFATPLVAAQATAAITSTISKVSQVIRKLVKTISNVGPKVRKIVDKLGEIIEKLSKLGKKLGKRVDGTSPSAARKTPHGDVNAPKEHTSPSSTHDAADGTTPSSAKDHGAPGDTTSPSSKADTGSPDGPGTSAKGPDGTSPTAKPRDSSLGDEPSTRAQSDGTKCKGGDPIDLGSGEMLLTQVDVSLGGTLPLFLQRTHLSSYRGGHLFGESWASTLDQRLEVDSEGVRFAGADGLVLTYPPARQGSSVNPLEGARWPLTIDAEGTYELSRPDNGHTLRFEFGQQDVRRLTSIRDRNGAEIAFDYDAAGTVSAVRHSGGYHITVETAAGLVTALRLSNAGGDDIPLVRYRYDSARRLVEVINSSERPIKFDYDLAGRIVRWEDRNGEWYRYFYDSAGRTIRTEGAGNALAGTIGYDVENRVTVYTNSLGEVTTYEFNEFNQVVRETNPLGQVTVSEWGRYDKLLARTDPLGRTTKYDYDERGCLIGITRPDGTRTLAEYNELRLPTTLVDPDGAVWRRAYDDKGNLVEVMDPAGTSTRYRYTPEGHVESIEDGLGNVRTVSANAAGLPVAVTDQCGRTTRYSRDQFGRISAVVDPSGGVSSLKWTVEGKLLEHIRPDGAVERWNYDGQGNESNHIDPLGRMTRTTTTHFDLPAVETGPDGRQVTFRYDSELRLIGVRNPQGLEWRYRYDAAGNLVEEIDFDGRVLRYEHDEAGQLVARTNGAGQIIRFTRDVLGNVVSKTGDDGAMSAFEYDELGRMTRAVNNGAEVVFERDVMGRVRAESVNGKRMSYQYDILGRRTHRTTPSGIESQWAYDAGHQPIALNTAGRVLSFGYDHAGREIERLLDTGTIVAQSWDPNHRLAEQTVSTVAGTASQAALIQRRSYRYREDGYVTSVRDHLNGTRSYELDHAGRVVEARGPDAVERYDYDVDGNVTTAAWSGDDIDAQGARTFDGSRLVEAGRVRYEYDAHGRVVLRQKKRLSVKPATWRYAWNSEDKLIGVTTPDGARWRYVYDPLGRRIAKLLLSSDGASVIEQTDFTWDGVLLVEQRHSSGKVVSWNHHPETLAPLTEVRGVKIDGRSQEWVDQQFYSIITDLVGTPTELVDTSGAVAWRADTTVWGKSLARLTNRVETPLRFPGQYYDAESELHYNYFRFYDPATGRYTSSDPLGLGGGANPSSFVSNPAHRVDMLGLSADDCAKAAIRKLPEDDQERILSRIVRGDKKGRPFGSPQVPRMPTLDEFNPRFEDIRAGDLAGQIGSTKHGIFPDQAGSISQLSNDDLIRLRMEDPISGTRGGDGIGLSGGHHRSAEIANRVASGQLSPDAIVRVLIHD